MVVLAGLMLVVALATVLTPAAARAQNTEATFVIGALLGDDVSLDLGIIDEAQAKFENSPIYGGRVGWYGFPLGVEASVLYSSGGIEITPSYLKPENVSLLYAEVNALLIIIPGPIAPFATGGIGAHRLHLGFGDTGSLTETAFGWNWGGGVKARLGPVAIRADLRDHVSKFESDTILALLGTTNTFHNWEASVSLGVAF